MFSRTLYSVSLDHKSNLACFETHQKWRALAVTLKSTLVVGVFTPVLHSRHLTRNGDLESLYGIFHMDDKVWYDIPMSCILAHPIAPLTAPYSAHRRRRNAYTASYKDGSPILMRICCAVASPRKHGSITFSPHHHSPPLLPVLLRAPPMFVQTQKYLQGLPLFHSVLVDKIIIN